MHDRLLRRDRLHDRDHRDDSDACTTDSCDTATGCVYAAVTCDDSDACTTDSCDTATGCVYEALSCDDSDACTTDSCDTASGCVYEALSCDDSDACTTDSCDAATGCAHDAITCDDSDACTTDSCDTEAGCAHAAITCDDSDVCTTDSCDTESGCVYAAITCDDSDACTTDSCDTESGCVYAAITCDDSDVCTTDSCDTETGCVYAAVTCDDSDACTTDSCDTEAGCAYTAITCDDSDACTTDSCDTETGCSYLPTVGLCANGGTCIGHAAGYTCECADGWVGDACDLVCTTAEIAPVGCAAQSSQSACADSYDDTTDDSYYGLNCTDVPDACVANGVDGCNNAGGCIRQGWILWDLGLDVQLSQIQYLSDWWMKRPEDVEIWVSDSRDDVPDGGATLVQTFTGNEAPWQCVAGEPCVEGVVPAECCPNGFGGGAVQDTAAVGTLYPKWDVINLESTASGRYWFLVIRSAYDPEQAQLRDIEFYGCPTDGDQCVGVVCEHGGTCVDEVDAFHCECAAGFMGDACAEYDCAATDCDDANACTADSCDAIDGCASEPVDCSDGDVCTDDACDTVTGCSNQPIDCDDADACTIDSCAEAPPCPLGELLGDSCYLVTPTVLLWSAANIACESQGGHLASIADATENANVHTALVAGCSGDAWLGGNDIAEEGTYVWTDGTPFSYTHWYGGDGPPGGLPNSDVVKMHHAAAATWFNLRTDLTAPCYICEFEPVFGEPLCAHDAVTCDDDTLCTADSCDTATGCTFTPLDCAECTELVCDGNTVCDDSAGMATCTCDVGYTGDDCSECAPDYDLTGDGVCRCISDAFTCLGDTASLTYLYVDDAPATATEDGTSWETAFTVLQDAVDAAAGLDAASVVILVKQGTYKAAVSGGTVLTLSSPLTVVGAYSDSLTGTDRDDTQRDPSLYHTFLDGDFSGDGAGGSDDARSVVVATAGAWLQGVTITGGYSNDHGAGIYLDGADGFSLVDSVVLENRVEATLQQRGTGAGIYCTNTVELLINASEIAANTARGDGDGGSEVVSRDALGAGLHLEACDTALVASAVVANQAIGQNSSDATGDAYGGGLYASDSSVSMLNVVFFNNSAAGGSPSASDSNVDGGAAAGGGLYLSGGASYWVSVALIGNTATGGDGLDGDSGTCDCNPGGCTVVVATRDGGDGGIAQGGGGYFWNVSPVMDASVSANTATGGAGGGSEDGSPGCAAANAGNDGAAAGGGLYFGGTSSPDLGNVSFSGNTPDDTSP
ncbi:MAG: hypothetical protein H6744_13225 [Deltaproteobacteria bacterium]|nr:hypothetical protein [Deltaproteobacteria bacterium]